MFEVSDRVICDATLLPDATAPKVLRFLCCCRKVRVTAPLPDAPLPKLPDAVVVDPKMGHRCDLCGARHTFLEAFEDVFQVRHEDAN